jgi:hypothetical protein
VTLRIVGAHGEIYEYSYNYLLGMVISVFVAYVSSFLGIGSGMVDLSSRGLGIKPVLYQADAAPFQAYSHENRTQ